MVDIQSLIEVLYQKSGIRTIILLGGHVLVVLPL